MTGGSGITTGSTNEIADRLGRLQKIPRRFFHFL